MDIRFLDDRHDAFESDFTVFETLFVVEAVSISREGDHALGSCGGDFGGCFFEKVHDRVVVFEAVEPVADTTRYTRDQRCCQAMLLENRNAIDRYEVDCFQAGFLSKAAEEIEFVFPVAPVACGVVNVSLQRARHLGWFFVMVGKGLGAGDRCSAEGDFLQ